MADDVEQASQHAALSQKSSKSWRNVVQLVNTPVVTSTLVSWCVGPFGCCHATLRPAAAFWCMCRERASLSLTGGREHVGE